MAVCFFSTIFLSLLIIATAIISTTAIPIIRHPTPITRHQELETALQTLRNHGYILFTNAVTTSDIQFQLLTAAAGNYTSQFTMFAPKDAPIFTLDMESDAAHYVSTLRYHVIPNRRLTFSDLQNLSSPFLDTLLTQYSVLIGKTLGAAVSLNGTFPTAGVMVDGARVSDPDLFLGSRIAIHGIDGILSTGLNLHHQVFSDSSVPFSPAQSPAPVTGNIPAMEGLSPVSNEFDWNNSPSEAPVARVMGNIPAMEGLSPAPVTGNVPAMEGLSPVSNELDWNNAPAAPPAHIKGKIPVKNLGVENLKKKHHRKGHRHPRHRQQWNHDL